MDKEMETLDKWSAREKRKEEKGKEQTTRDSLQTDHDDMHCRQHDLIILDAASRHRGSLSP